MRAKLLLFHLLDRALRPGAAPFTDIADVREPLGEQNRLGLPRPHRLVTTGAGHDRRLFLMERGKHIDVEYPNSPHARGQLSGIMLQPNRTTDAKAMPRIIAPIIVISRPPRSHRGATAWSV